ncbi:hypothetical protein ABFS82_05G001000 [Erythranthe guttata]|uniref:uncharacterized protein LOC105952630 n=1 Tax=Erythranthe guttata TaxID=4155 RepID=UPI00064DE470|nr:PREDICTED: uncharacterized protein LOC105952630 [Erythranthe guttata]|eukprot:XP_012831653.1 PREDICTED: uncharacterized protein LOC105952630 [Erythranthe guttata]
MEPEKDMEIIEKVVRKLMEDDEFNAKTSSNLPAIEKTGGRRQQQQQRQLLSKLLSELESVEEDKNVSEESTEEGTVEDRICSEIDEKRKEEVDSSDEEEEEEEIMKELKNIKRQNSITHCLLTTLIVLTLAWQFSEVSLILKIKNGLSNPFKAVGGIVKGLWQTRSGMMKRASDLQKQVTEQASLKIPQLELPGVDEHNQN